ncbi:NACHT domain protein [Clostridium homopropionicum DSM 5847]|uniref:NACHT domain protein n=1 Tax=Clostridium homopropionicum DSM 5847 TaxID=1121318 RepID=A0A0L6ZEF8_9CLOT|nr:NACHT domain-containing protein [Clostridium homopropionicum]KOA21178.1 NACHT domain protein [Clostridium homopropionicum DSM 5847]SFG26212.1 NACHT domain-containing protein [Clostridium homopropionicum]
MKRLCFGTYASVLRSCIPKKKTKLVTPQKKFIGIVLMSLNRAYDITDNGYMTTRLVSCNNSLPADITEKAQDANVKVVAEYFKKKVIPILDPNKTKLAVLAIRDIIASDTTIDGDTVVDLVSDITKSTLLTQNEFVLEEFLAGVFLYTARAVDNTVGKDFAKAINDGYVTGFDGDKDKIKFVDHLSEDIHIPLNMAIFTDPQPVVSSNSLNQQVEELNEIMRNIADALGKNPVRQATHEDWNEFYFALKETVRLGRSQSEATGELKTFIDNITILFKDWEEVMRRRSLNMPFNNTSEVFNRIVNEVYYYLTFSEYAVTSATQTPVKKMKPNFSTYLQNAKSKYSTIKTLLYNDHPKPFYDFYVCNNIERRIPVPGKFGTSYKLSTIQNVTVKSLSECSRFVILAGTGGLGKSMMMRHLLLNSVENYEEMLTIPVFIPLKDFDETVDSLFEYAFSKVTSLCGEITEEQFEDILNKGKCLLLFDGLDEIGSAYAKRFERELEVFTDKYPENCFVISSRPYQSFISYSRFTVLQLKPFSKIQALKLIDNLEFRPDEPIIKDKFRNELNNNLYRTHSTFIENPLLLTIMLLTFEQYAEVPSKMHVFYREAFAALAVKHDASKGAYKRTLKTGLTADKFADYFAELCSRSYYDEKFELTEDEFAKYYNSLKEREKANDRITTASDYLYDLCSNMCLMYFESGKYHFTHRSFQEYFCALYFSKQKDKNLKSIGDFFENRHSRMYGDKTFNMLYDMIPDKVEEYIFIPFLTRLYELCDNEEGYWTFLETMYPSLSYEIGETNEFVLNSPKSYLFDFIKQLNGILSVNCNDFPHYDSLVRTEYVYVFDEDESQTLVDADDVNWEYKDEYGTPDPVGWVYEFDVEAIREEPEEYKELLDCLDNDEFVLKEEYVKIRQYLEKLQAKQRPTGDSLFDLF